MELDDIRIRAARKEDASALLAIYAPYVRETAITFEYDVPTAEEYASRILRFGSTHPFLVAESSSGEIMGYAYAHPYYGYAAYACCAELTIYLRQDVRGHHLGSRLYDELERCLSAMGVINLYACITRTDRPDDPHVPPTSVLFHEKRGFREIGRFKSCGFKFDRWYDTVWMEKDLGSHVDGVAPVLKPFSEVARELGY